MVKKAKNRFDNTAIGFLIGFILPLAVFFMVYLLGSYEVSFLQFVQSLERLNVLIKLGSLCVFLNSAVFMLFIKTKYEKAARGVLGATIIYAFVVLISKAL